MCTWKRSRRVETTHEPYVSLLNGTSAGNAKGPRDTDQGRSRAIRLIALVMLCVSAASVRVAHAQSASGGGVLTFSRGELEFRAHYGFTARTRPNGTVDGQAESRFRLDNNTTIWGSHFSIEAMEFMDEKTAILSGTVTRDFDPTYIGTTMAFVVRDNGEGANHPPDQATGVLWGADFDPPLNFIGADETFMNEAAELMGRGTVEEELANFSWKSNIQVWPHARHNLKVSAVPEPSTVMLGALAIIGVLTCRRW